MNEDKWGKKEANDIVGSKYIEGIANKDNLKGWTDYAKGNSFSGQ
jgi:hypothetical protein